MHRLITSKLVDAPRKGKRVSDRQRDSSVVTAVQAIYEALEPLPQEARERVVASALSLLGMEVAPGTTPASASPAPVADASKAGRSRGLSPVEFMQEKAPATNAQKIAAFAYYRERFEGQARFSRGDLKGYFSKVRETPPGNYDRDFASAVKQGWIHEDGSESYLTSKGLEAVEAGFGGKARPRGRAASKKSTRKAQGQRSPRGKSTRRK